jgi:predicted class III extradiol MEMO1 family dioxygenase
MRYWNTMSVSPQCVKIFPICIYLHYNLQVEYKLCRITCVRIYNTDVIVVNSSDFLPLTVCREMLSLRALQCVTVFDTYFVVQ